MTAKPLSVRNLPFVDQMDQHKLCDIKRPSILLNCGYAVKLLVFHGQVSKDALPKRASAQAERGNMFIKRGLVVMGCYLAATMLPAHAGETSGQLNMSLTIRPSCEVSSRIDDGRYQVQDRGCAGAAAYKVESGMDNARLLTASTQANSANPQASSPKIVTIYW